MGFGPKMELFEMANSVLKINVIAKEALMILDNNLIAAKQVYRGLESEFGNAMNGYQAGDTVSIKRPTDFTVRDGAVASNQDVTEGSTSITVDKQKGIDFGFTSKELTLDIKELSDRVIKPAMVQLANQIDSDIYSLYKQVPNWVGTPGQTINSYADFAKGPERMMNMRFLPLIVLPSCLRLTIGAFLARRLDFTFRTRPRALTAKVRSARLAVLIRSWRRTSRRTLLVWRLALRWSMAEGRMSLMTA